MIPLTSFHIFKVYLYALYFSFTIPICRQIFAQISAVTTCKFWQIYEIVQYWFYTLAYHIKFLYDVRYRNYNMSRAEWCFSIFQLIVSSTVQHFHQYLKSIWLFTPYPVKVIAGCLQTEQHICFQYWTSWHHSLVINSSDFLPIW